MPREDEAHLDRARAAVQQLMQFGSTLQGILERRDYDALNVLQQVQTSTLVTRETIHGTLRMLLGATLGGLLGVLWTDDQPVRLENVSLSLGALAFFVGFSVEVVFRLVDTLVRAAADRLSKPS